MRPRRSRHAPWLASGAVLLALGICTPLAAAETAVGETTFGGRIFINASHLDSYSRGQRTPGARDGVDLTRFYVDVDHRFSPRWSAHLTTDINWLRDQSPTDLWVKRAYLQGAFSKALTLRVGVADLPWVGYVNQWSGYRYVDNDLVMRLKFGSSADWGVHLLGTLGTRGQWQYATSVISGSSYKRPRTGDGPDVEVRLGWQPTTHTVLALGGYRGKRALDGGEHMALHTAQRWDAMAAYADGRWRLGAQYFRASDWNQVRSPVSDRASGWSAWASVLVAPRWSVFVRHDDARTSERLDPLRRDRYNNLGVEYQPSRALRLAVVAKRERLANATAALASSNELGVWAQIAF